MRAAIRWSLCLCVGFCFFPDGTWAESFTKVCVVPGNQASELEKKVVHLLLDRMAEQGAAHVEQGPKNGHAAGELTIYLGVPARHEALSSECGRNGVRLPDTNDPGAEGFVLKSAKVQGGPALLAAGTDDRGILYAAGEILRRTVNRGSSFEFPLDLELRTAPAFRFRGTEVSQGTTITDLTHARAWTDAEWQRVVLDYALAGANTFGLGHVTPSGHDQYAFVKSYGLDTLLAISPNRYPGDTLPEWQATEAIGRIGYLCLSVREARKAILDHWEKAAQADTFHDIVRFYSGDGGGCECEKCAPYGRTYIRMCEDIASIILKHHPKTIFFATNQKLDNAGDQAIFDYLNAEPRPWLTAFCYGPGSNAMGWMPGRRQTHRMDLFSYPAFGPMDRYIREIVHQLPASQSIVFFTDATHWVYSEYGLLQVSLGPDKNGDVPPHWGHRVYEQHPDPALAQVYSRRTFHARPRNYYDAFQQTERYGEGDVTYSEGHHDHFNQWMWQRLLWDPHKTLDGVVDEYCHTWFGPEAAPDMAKAIFQLETNLSTPIADNAGIDRYLELVKAAGAKMPEHIMKKNYLWRQHMQKACLDKYVQLRLREQTARQHEVAALLASVLKGGDINAAIAQAESKVKADIEMDDMRRLKAEAGKLGDEGNEIFGVRSEGFFNLDQDFVGLAWIRKQLDRAAAAPADKRKDLLAGIVHYEDPGPGGFYDDAGDPARAPHMTYGWTYGGGVSGGNRPSQRTMAFTRDEKQGVTFEYSGLDPKAKYRVRLTLVRPRVAPRYADKQPQKTESVYADDHLLVKDVALPVDEVQFFEYDIPQDATRDGKVQIRFEKSAGVGEGPAPQVEGWRNTGGWGTLVSEVWLMKRP